LACISILSAPLLVVTLRIAPSVPRARRTDVTGVVSSPESPRRSRPAPQRAYDPRRPRRRWSCRQGAHTLGSVASARRLYFSRRAGAPLCSHTPKAPGLAGGWLLEPELLRKLADRAQALSSTEVVARPDLHMTRPQCEEGRHSHALRQCSKSTAAEAAFGAAPPHRSLRP
jgi:hypothetical protein